MKWIANNAIVSLREEADPESSLSDEVLYGMEVDILEEHGEWVKVRTHYRYEGFCFRNELIQVSEESYGRQRESCVVNKAYADVLSLPKVQGICMQCIPRGGRVVRVKAGEETPGWSKVLLADGRKGYIKEAFLGKYYDAPFTENEEEFRKRLVELAKTYLGTQYRWGGKSPLGIDCSGLTSMCYMLCGVNTYRDAKIMEGFPVKEISFDEKKPGDLLYFPGHIAMYLGDGKYIHSTAKDGSDGVVINSLNPEDEDYRDDLVKILSATGSIF